MHRLGTIIVWLGVILTVGGLIFGFSAMFIDADHQAVNILGLIPLGFIALLAGVVMVLFSRPKRSSGTESRQEPD
jgi:hypothetical protein